MSVCLRSVCVYIYEGVSVCVCGGGGGGGCLLEREKYSQLSNFAICN